MMLISRKYTRKELAESLGIAGGGGKDMQKQINAAIRARKKAGEIVEVRDFIDPAVSRKRRQFFCFLARTREIEA